MLLQSRLSSGVMIVGGAQALVGLRERLFERALPLLDLQAMGGWVEAASVCDGLVKGLRHPDWPEEPWDGLRRLVLMMLEPLAAGASGQRGRTRMHLVLSPSA